MPEIKIKHVVSFSSEDKIHKAENVLKPETYRKWKCATPGEKNATIVLQFEKATQIHSIDIGNESSAFIEILVGRSSDSLNDFQVLLVASSFMSPLESRNESHTNRVRMFGPEKLSQQLVKEKWDCVQIVCTQPFNKNISYGLSFIKFHSPPEKIEQPKQLNANATELKLGAFKVKNDEDSDLSVGSWFGKRKHDQSPDANTAAPSYASTVLASDSSPKYTAQAGSLKRKLDEEKNHLEPPSKKESPDLSVSKKDLKPVLPLKNVKSTEKDASSQNKRDNVAANDNISKKKPFNKIMEDVVFVLSGFVNPLRSQLRDKALEMGAKCKNDWDKTCTHLICAFVNTPKYIQVLKKSGKIVSKEWINDCYKKKTLLPWKVYLLGKITKGSSDESEYEPDANASESEDSEWVNESSGSESSSPPKEKEKKHSKKASSKQTNGQSLRSKKADEENMNVPKNPVKKLASPKKTSSDVLDQVNGKEDSETEDEDALEDYMALTDVDSDTENKIEKVKANKRNESSKDTNYPIKSDIEKLPLPELPCFFKKKHFFLYGKFSSEIKHKLQRYIAAYNGILEDYMSENVKYVITESKWDANFENALTENEDLLFVRPQWVLKCHEANKIVPYQPYIIIPDS